MKKMIIAVALGLSSMHAFCAQPNVVFENQWCQQQARVGQEIAALASKDSSQDQIIGEVGKSSQARGDFFGFEIVRYIAWKRPGFEGLKKGELESWFKPGSPQCRDMYQAIVRRVQ